MYRKCAEKRGQLNKYRGTKMEDHVDDGPACKKAKLFENEEKSNERIAHEDDQYMPEESRTETVESIKEKRIYLSENDVGIEEYICPQPGIGGVVKQRYSDFIVREVDKSGDIVKLLKIETGKDLEEKEKLAEDKINEIDDAEDAEEIDCPVSNEDLVRLQTLLTKSKENDTEETFITLAADNNKEHRKMVHTFIKEKYPAFDTETVQNDNEEKMVKVFLKKENKKGRRRWERSKEKTQKKFCHFVLYKENRDTMSAINLIADLLHVKSSLFTYSGTKDKRAITTQQICANRIDAKRLTSINKLVRNMAVGSFEYKDYVLKLGDLSGNHFSIVLRNISDIACNALVTEIMESLKENGYINYFGMQRFGSGAFPTFQIGKEVLASNWKNVINLILKPRPEEDPIVYKAKIDWQEKKDSKAAYEMIKKRHCLEGHVLEVLAKQGEKSFYNAFQKIPRNTRLMYLHSYQSYIWNKIVSKRIQMYGIQPKVGDLVITKKAEIGEPEAETMTRCQVKEITEEDIQSAKFSITDVVMPLPGYDVTYPGYGAKEWYSEMLKADGFDIDNMRHDIKEYSLSGAYRYIIVKPGNIKWSISAYDDYCLPLLQTDLDVMNGKEPPATNKPGKFKALILEFNLPTSSYATMVLREITKLDTSSHKNIELN